MGKLITKLLWFTALCVGIFTLISFLAGNFEILQDIQVRVLLLAFFLFGVGAEKGLSYYYSRKEYAESIKRLKELQETLEKRSEIVRDNTFTGVIILVSGQKVESTFFERESDHAIIDKIEGTQYKADKIIGINYHTRGGHDFRVSREKSLKNNS
ncbi:UNVERIFIED_CONTAM: hypothetical protein POZ17_15915 [Ralstonia mannitolilytica]